MQSSIWGSWSRARPTVKGYALTVGIWALAAAAVIDGAQQPEPPADVAFLGSMTVTASRLDDSPLLADLGSMTVTASRLDAPLIADLGSMTVTARREDLVAQTQACPTPRFDRPSPLFCPAGSGDSDAFERLIR